MESEKKLLDDINSGSRAAMHRLYERYVGYAMAVALRYVPMRDDAEDVVQDSFIKVFSGISKFEYRGEGALQAWLLRIVTNEAVNFVRQQKRFTIVDEVPDNIEDEEPEVERVPPAELTRMIGARKEGTSMKTKHHGQMSESFLTAVFLSLSGGLQDAYTYLFRGKVFANAQTGNIVLLSTNIMDGRWDKVLHYLVPL